MYLTKRLCDECYAKREQQVAKRRRSMADRTDCRKRLRKKETMQGLQSYYLQKYLPSMLLLLYDEVDTSFYLQLLAGDKAACRRFRVRATAMADDIETFTHFFCLVLCCEFVRNGKGAKHFRKHGMISEDEFYQFDWVGGL